MNTTLVRIPVSIHKAIKVAAAADGKTAAQWIADELTPALKTSAGAPYLPKEANR